MSIFSTKPAKFRVRGVDAGPGERNFILEHLINRTTARFLRAPKVTQEWETLAFCRSQEAAEDEINRIINYPKNVGVIHYDEDGDKLPSAPGELP